MTRQVLGCPVVRWGHTIGSVLYAVSAVRSIGHLEILCSTSVPQSYWAYVARESFY